MKTNGTISKLKRLQAEVDAIRGKLGIGAPNSVLYLASLDTCDDEQVVVEADGFGGATTSIVEGNYPIDYLTRKSKRFDKEDDAVQAATEIVEQNAEAEAVLA